MNHYFGIKLVYKPFQNAKLSASVVCRGDKLLITPHSNLIFAQVAKIIAMKEENDNPPTGQDKGGTNQSKQLVVESNKNEFTSLSLLTNAMSTALLLIRTWQITINMNKY